MDFEIQLGPEGTPPCICRGIFSTRARYMRLKVNAEGEVMLTMPRGVSRETAEAFLMEQKHWLRQVLGRMKLHHAAETRLEEHCFPDQVEFGFFGTVFHTEYYWRPVCWQGARLDRERQALCFTGAVLDQDLTVQAFAMLLKRTAEVEFSSMLQCLSEKIGIPFADCTIRLQSSRWGSCSGRRTISLNALLLLFPKELAEYVMIHELCHIREMNHSASFWALVARFVPDWQRKRALLNAKAKALPEILRQAR